MSKLIEKFSYEAQNDKIVEILRPKVGDGNVLAITKLQEYIAEQIELAYKAGSIHFNALTHETRVGATVKRWADLEDEYPVTGPDSILPSLYSQSKGFKK
jgi:hypothetical protein